MSCSAVVSFTEVIKYPEYQIDVDKKKKRANASQDLRNEMLYTEGHQLRKEYRCYVHFPSSKSHTGHVIGIAAGISRPVDVRLIKEIDKLVADGVCSLGEIKRSLKAFVIGDLFKDRNAPPPTDRRFFPKKKDIRNHFYASYTKRKLAKIDQENLALLVQKWQADGDPMDRIFFREYVSAQTEDIDSSYDDNVECNDETSPFIQCHKSLLFVHQLAWQRRLLLRYGQKICLLDATYKTTKYALPLFFLCVKTNCRYMVVASFVIQNETSNDIREALEVLKGWNPLWKPTSFMTDKCSAEIKAIEDTFSNCQVFLCDFHREQAWERWLKKSENGVSYDREQILSLFRAIAHAENSTRLTECIHNLTESDVWKSSEKLQSYFNKEWLPDIKRWAWFYRTGKLCALIRTNNGVERQNRLLKECHLRVRVDKSLSSLITVLHTEFFPECYDLYVTENLKSSSGYKKYNQDIPLFLRDRPRKIVQHCVKRFSIGGNIPDSRIQKSGEEFLVNSSSGEEKYTVFFGNDTDFPSCSCFDFKKHFLPCFHIFSIIRSSQDISWDSFPDWYANSVYMTLDSDIVNSLSSKNAMKEKEIFLNLNEPAEDLHEMDTDSQFQEDDKIPYSDSLINQRLLHRVIDTASVIRSTAFDVNSNLALENADIALNQVLEDLSHACNHQAGLIYRRPTKLGKRSNTSTFDHLPRKRPKINPFLTRVGAKASKMRPFMNIKSLNSALSNYSCPKTSSVQEENILPEPAEVTVDIHVATSKQEEMPASTNMIDVDSNCRGDFLKRATRKACSTITSVPPVSKFTRFTPPLSSVRQHRISHNILYNGPHANSLLQLKSLEPFLNRGEHLTILTYDKGFKDGWLIDEVINSFLWQLQRQNKGVIFGSSTQALLLEKKRNVGRLWNDETVSGKQFVFLPWNPSGSHWVLLAVDVQRRVLLYLDPIQMISIETNILVKMANVFISRIMLSKFSVCITGVESPNRSLQADGSSCGVYICMYAKWLTQGESLQQSGSAFSYRRFIYEFITGFCLQRLFCNGNVSQCPLCTHEDKTEWVKCDRCRQWYHCDCVGLDKAEAESTYFVCSSQKLLNV